MNIFARNLYPDKNGNIELNSFDYIEFYNTDVMPKIEYDYEENKDCLYEGKPSGNFITKLNESFNDIVVDILADKKLEQLQGELEKEGKQVCMFNTCILSMFIVERAKNHYVFLLKPSLREIVETLDYTSKLTFTDKNGNSVETSSGMLIDKIQDLLKACHDDNRYEIDRIVSWDKISNKSLICCYFVYNLTMFLNKYFPLKRKKDALVSTKEVKLILYMMKLMGLTNAELTNKRYWQLMNAYEKISKNLITKDYASFHIGDKTYKMPLRLIPYSMWHNGRLDWTENEMPRFNGDVGTVLQF